MLNSIVCCTVINEITCITPFDVICSSYFSFLTVQNCFAGREICVPSESKAEFFKSSQVVSVSAKKNAWAPSLFDIIFKCTWQICCGNFTL